jgi:hypothetical protein
MLSSSLDHLGLVLVCIFGACIVLGCHRPSNMDNLEFCYLMSSFVMMVQGVLEVFNPSYDAEDHMLINQATLENGIMSSSQAQILVSSAALYKHRL